MTFGLLAFHAALAKPPNFKTSLACGALGFLCFITYNGYWPLAALAMSVHALRGNTKWSAFLQKGLQTATGFAIPAVLLLVIASASGVDILHEYRLFASTVSQGNFDEGWSLTFEYFWHAEHLIVLVFASLSIFALIKSKARNTSLSLWVSAILFIYLCLAIPSTITHSFVVYGRLARQIMPFLVLLSAAGISNVEGMFLAGRRVVKILLLAILLQALWNYAASYRLSYPREFASEARELHPGFSFSEKRLIFGAPALCRNNGYIAENVKRFDVPPAQQNPPIVGQLLLAAPHPDTFLPYQYEGYTYEQRTILRRLKPDMRLYKAADEFMSGTNPIWTGMKNCLVNE
jgi:hypothetical protein